MHSWRTRGRLRPSVRGPTGPPHTLRSTIDLIASTRQFGLPAHAPGGVASSAVRARIDMRANSVKWPDVPAEQPDARLAASVSPVSYTHLRAHETRHDLVCRLLLEK